MQNSFALNVVMHKTCSVFHTLITMFMKDYDVYFFFDCSLLWLLLLLLIFTYKKRLSLLLIFIISIAAVVT